MRAVADHVEIIYPKTGWTLANVPEKLASEHSDLNRCVPAEQTPLSSHGRTEWFGEKPIPPSLAEKAAQEASRDDTGNLRWIGKRQLDRVYRLQGDGLIQFAHYHFTSA